MEAIPKQVLSLRKRREGNLYPETVSSTNKLSPKGKMQVIQGVRKCSKFDVKYIGNALYRPVEDHEIAFLVPLMIRLSNQLNFDMRWAASLRFWKDVLLCIIYGFIGLLLLAMFIRLLRIISGI